MIIDWCAVTGEVLSRQDVAVIRRMDDAFREALSRERREAMEKDMSKNG